MGALADFRRQYPQYDDMSDVELADALYRKYYSDLPKDQVFARLGVKPPQGARGEAPVIAPVAPVTPQVAPEEEGVLSALGRAVERGVPSLRQGLARIVEEAPEIAASLYSSLPGPTSGFAPLVKGLGAAAAQSETYKNLTGEGVAAERAAAERQLAELGPRKFGGFFEEEGFGRKLGSLAETVAESAIPVGAGLVTGAVTRSPLAAGLVMGAGSVPLTYGGIRERQEAEGIRNIDRAVLGTAASSALDVLTGVGGKVLSGTAAIAAKELLEAGLKQAALRVVKSGGEEAVTESLQNVVEQVAGGTNPLTKKAMLETLEAGLAGALGGTVFTGATEVAAAPFRPKAAPNEATNLAADPAVRAEFQKLAAQEVAAVMAADPEIDQRAAVDIVSERAEDLLVTAATNVAAAKEEADVTPDVGAELDVSEGTGAGATPDLGPAPAEAGTPELGATDTGRLGEPIPSVPVADVGAGAGVPALTPAPEVAAPTPAPVIQTPAAEVPPLEPVALPEATPIEMAPVEAATPAFDTTPITEAPNRKERVAAASQLISDIAMANPELQALPKTKYTQAANQMATAASRGEQFDPLDIMYKVAGVERPAPTVAVEPAAAPELPAAPSVDQVAVAPVKAAIEATAAPAPVVPGAVPNLAQSAAREVGITPAAPPAPPAVATPPVTLPPMPEAAAPAVEPVAPPAQKTLNDLAGAGTVNPENTNEVLVEGGGVQLTPVSPNIVQLDSLRAVERGGGRKAMQQLIKAADGNGTAIQLSPEPFAAPAGKEMTPTELSDWYAGFGFEAQPDGTMVRPASAPPSATITPEPVSTPQQIVKDIERFARSEAEDRGFDPGMFGEGARDVARGVEPLPDNLILEGQGQDALDAYKAGMEFGRERLAEAQAAPAAPAPAPVSVAPTAPEVGMAAPAPEVGGVEPINDATVDAVLAPKLTKAQLRKLDEAAGIQRMKLSSMQKRIARSRSAEETMSLAGRLMTMARNPDDSVGILSSLFNSTPPPILQALLAPLETADVVRLGKKAGMANVTRIDDMMRNEYIPYVNRIMQRASKLAEKWADFTSRSPEGADAMSDVMFFSNMTNADPSMAASAGEYLKIDPDFQDLIARLAAETDPKKRSNLRGQITKRRGEIQRLYFGATDADGSTVSGWKDVPPQGKQLFREARDYYRADFKEHYRLLIQRIDDAQFDEETTVRLKAAVDDMFKEAEKRAVYFPMKRFGDYWVSVGKGRDGEFHMFETASAQDAFIARLRREGETRDIDFSKGKDTLRLGLRNQTADASVALKGILDMIDNGGVSDVDLLKDHIFQMYLTALPEADMRRRFIHRQFKTGFSTDTLRTFASTAIASANQLGRLAYNYKFKNLIDQSYAETAGNPSKRRLDTITREMDMRVQATMAPESEGFADQLANFGAKATFLFILSSPKSAIMNLTQLHIVGLPTLSAEFGEKETYSMAARYTGQMLTGKRIANPFRDADGNVRLQLPEFTTEGSAYIRGLQETDPDRYEAIQRAWGYAQEREVTESTFSSAANVYERSNEPSGEMTFAQAARSGNVATAVQRAATNAVNGMGALFHHTERMGREIMYMSAFELAYDRNLKQGMNPTAAADAAMEKAADLTNKGMFDFSNWNKSRAAKHPVGKLALQMRSYSIAMTSLLFRSFTNMVALHRTKAERLAAARVFFGVGAMTTLYGGLRASQFYMMAMLGYGLVEMIKSGMGDDDEEKEIEQGYLNPETIDRELLKYADDEGRELSKKDMDYFIRTVWIPETFGKGGTMQEALGLSDDAAKKLATVADMGLPGAFGVDISNSVALTSLWHPVDTKSNDPEAAFNEGLGRVLLGPSGSIPAAALKFNTEANAGNFDKAIEAITPAFLRGYVKAERLKDEGLVIGKDRDIVLKDPSFYDTYSLAMQSLGFPEAETSRAMQLDIRAGEIERDISKEKTDLLNQRYRAVMELGRGPTKEAEREFKKVERAIEIYNLNYPSNAIDAETKKRSIEQKQQDAGEKMYGLGIDSKIPIRQPLVEERAAELGQ